MTTSLLISCVLSCDHSEYHYNLNFKRDIVIEILWGYPTIPWFATQRRTDQWEILTRLTLWSITCFSMSEKVISFQQVIMIILIDELDSIRLVIVMIIISILIFMSVGELKDEKILYFPCKVWFLIFDVEDDHFNLHVFRSLMWDSVL